MSVVAAALRELIALGVEGDALIAAVERIEKAAGDERAKTVEQAVKVASATEDAKLAARKAKAAERTRKWREAKEAESVTVISPSVTVASPTVTTHHRDGQGAGATRTPTHVEVSSSSSLRSEEVVVGGVVGATASPPADDWPEGKADHHAKLLVEAVASPWLDPHKSPDLVTTRGRIAAWKRDGASWEHDVLPVVIGLCGNRRSRISSWKFFDAAVSRTIAENRAALEIPVLDPRKAHERPSHLQPAPNSRAARRGVWAEVLAEERGEEFGGLGVGTR